MNETPRAPQSTSSHHEADLQRWAAFLGGPLKMVDRLAPSERAFLLQRGGSRLVLKRLEDAHAANLEASVLRHLAEHKDLRFGVPRLIGHFQDRNESLIVTEYHPAEIIPWHSTSQARWTALGLALGAVHLALFSFDTNSERLSSRIAQRRAEDEHEILRAQGAQLRLMPPSTDRDMLLQYLDDRSTLIEVALPPPPIEPGIEQPIHNDFNQYNYRFTKGPPLVTDWERSIVAPCAYEVVRVLNHLPLLQPDRCAAFLSAYHSVRPLSATALRLGIKLYLIELAAKRWPMSLWLKDQSQGAHALGNAEIIRAIVAHLEDYQTFYEAFAQKHALDSVEDGVLERPPSATW